MQSAFDPATFAQMTFTEANSTRTIPIPAGDWPATCVKQEIKIWENRDKTASGLKCVLTFEFTDPALQEITGRKKNLLTYEIMLDLTPENGLDFGKGANAKLGRAREAFGLNVPGQPFSFDMFVGREVMTNVAHREYEGNPVAEIKGLARL